uniref:Uncharacterized protein n=1 Tax=Sphaerodactylus townsendi TaxID=933632 RepID=A0ACB8F546_9SAUR
MPPCSSQARASWLGGARPPPEADAPALLLAGAGEGARPGSAADARGSDARACSLAEAEKRCPAAPAGGSGSDLRPATEGAGGPAARVRCSRLLRSPGRRCNLDNALVLHLSIPGDINPMHFQY